jgi:hypothetical protein
MGTSTWWGVAPAGPAPGLGLEAANGGGQPLSMRSDFWRAEIAETGVVIQAIDQRASISRMTAARSGPQATASCAARRGSRRLAIG